MAEWAPDSNGRSQRGPEANIFGAGGNVLPAGMRVLVCTAKQDMRKSFDTLAAVVSQHLNESPENGTLYVFFGRGARRVKVLWWDGNGYCLLAKRLHRALFVVPASGEKLSVRIDGAALAQLLRGVSKENVKRQIRAQLH
jgi:transposase